MITCSKTYRDIPLSHRQPLHAGRCSRIHGHSWSITLTFESDSLDANGFVIDFGDLHFIEDWIDEHLDHGIVLCHNDPEKERLQAVASDGLLHITWVSSASCEGIAQFLFETFQPMVDKKTQGRARIKSLHLEEDSKNSALYSPPQS
ncbi:MAG: 6-carboxytetrahydropterin synthase [Opitutales bacterium]|nr:6-carboxytetrahydropterin synthase [Opitutales bacterium]